MFQVLKKDAHKRYASKSAAYCEIAEILHRPTAKFFPTTGESVAKLLSGCRMIIGPSRHLPTGPGVPNLSIERNSDEIEEIRNGPGGIIRDVLRCFRRHRGLEKWRSSDRYGRNLGRQEHHPEARLCRRNSDSVGLHRRSQNRQPDLCGDAR